MLRPLSDFVFNWFARPRLRYTFIMQTHDMKSDSTREGLQMIICPFVNLA